MNTDTQLSTLLGVLMCGCALGSSSMEYDRTVRRIEWEATKCSWSVSSEKGHNACQMEMARKLQELDSLSQTPWVDPARDQAKAIREQTEVLRGAAADTKNTVWCVVAVGAGEVSESCSVEQADCNRAWGALVASGQQASSCVERPAPLPTSKKPLEHPPVKGNSSSWCLQVEVEGSRAESCYPSPSECVAAWEFHKQSGTTTSLCEGAQALK